jgi:hypothetical protein
LVTAIVGTGIGVVVFGLFLEVFGLVFLVRPLKDAQKKGRDQGGQVKAKGVVPDPGAIMKAIGELTDKIGVALGIPLVIMVFGMFFVGVGAAIIGVSS